MFKAPGAGYRSVFSGYRAVLALLLVFGFAALAPQAFAAPIPGTITGTVTAATGGAQLSGISVQSYVQNVSGGWDFSASAVTGALGAYTLSDLAPGTYRVFFYDSAGAYLGEYYDGSHTEAGATDVLVVSGVTESNIDATLDLAGHIAGTVTELAGGTPLDGIEVNVYAFVDGAWVSFGWMNTDVNGFYDFGGLPTGLYRVQFIDRNLVYAPEYYSGAFSADAATAVAVIAPGTTSLIDAALSDTATISGTVTSDGVTPIEGVMVVAYQNVVGESYEWQSEIVFTDVDGNYILTGLPSGNFVIGFYDTSGLYVPQFFYGGAYLIQDGTPVPATVGADTSGIDAMLEQFATITGTMTAADTLLPLEGEWVEVYRENAGVWQLITTVVTYPDGTYDTGPIPPGSYRVRFGITSIAYKAEYYSGAFLEADATSFTVAAGDTASGIDASLDPVDTVVTVSSANQPAGSTVGLGTTHPVDGFTLELTAGAVATSVDSVTIQDAGTVPAGDVVSGVDIYRDNGDAVFDASDVLLNATQGVFAGDSATVTFDAPEPVTAAQQYWVVYEFATVTANSGDTASSLVISITVTGANSVVNDAVVGGTFTIDAHVPDVTIWVPSSDEVLFQDPATIYGSASDLSGVESAEVRITRSDGQFWNGAAWVAAETWLPAILEAPGTADTGFSYDWAFDPAIQDGTPSYEIDARASNALGSQNLGYAVPVTNLTIENTVPVVEITSIVNGEVLTGSSAEVAGTASDTSGVFMVYLTIQRDSDGAYWDGFAWNLFPANITADGTDNWSYTWPFDPAFQDGTETYTIQAFAVDYNLNNGASAPVTGVMIDNLVDVTVTATGIDKTYDGTDAAEVMLFSADFMVGDDVTATYTTATFDDKNVGIGKPVSVSGIALTGADAGKYNLLDTTATTTADITALGITGAFTADDKVYDGNTDAVVLTRSLLGAIDGDEVALDGGVAQFDTADVGTGKAVTLVGATLVGADAGNYTLTSVADATADITARLVTVTADDASKLVGAPDPDLTFTVTSGSLVTGDAFTGALSRMAGEAAGSYSITQGTLALSSNYDLTFVPGTFTISNKPVDRLAGDTRYDTSVVIAEDANPGWVGVRHVILASGEDRSQPDALTAAGLAGVLDAPLLLVPYASVNTAIEDAVQAMPDGVQVHIVGGTAAVSTAVEAQLSGYSNVASVDRVAGSTRYGTAAAVARRMQTELVAQGQTLPAIALITNGNTPGAMFDALSASAISARNHYPVLLVKINSVPGDTSSALADLGLTHRYIVGGTAAVDSGVASSLGVAAGDRIAGATRYSTATEAAVRAKAEGWLSNVMLGFAAQIPDAATGGAYMGRNDGALVYVTATGVPAETASYLTAASASIETAVVFGGTDRVPESVRAEISELIN